MKTAGFTLIETLVALLALVVITTALLSVHLNILRAEKTAETLVASSRVAESVLAQQVFRLSASALDTNGWPGYEVGSESVVEGEGGTAPGEAWTLWTIAPSNQPGLGVQFELSGQAASNTARVRPPAGS